MPPNASLPVPPRSAPVGPAGGVRLVARRGLVLALVTLPWPAAAPAATRAAVPEGVVADGLVAVDLRGLDQAWARPGLSLVAYRRVAIDPVEVVFDPAWTPKRADGGQPLNAAELETIRRDLATVVREAFVATLQADAGWPVTDAVAPDVLRLHARLVDVYLNAPDAPTAGRTQRYTLSTGHLTLRADLLDAPTGRVLMRLADRRERPDSGTLRLTLRTTHAWDASISASHWARVLRAALDQAHGDGQR